MARADRLVRQKLRRTMLVTTKAGQTWRGVLMEADASTLSLFDAELIGVDRTVTKADGMVLLPRGDVAYMQIP